MDLFDTTQTALETAMRGQALREQALAENLANANTPGYQRRDVAFQDALASALSGGKAAVESVRAATTTDSSAPLRLDGSNVDVDREAASLARTGLEHEALVTVAGARHDILRVAIGVA
jgi:flagellar basal-body rod protein FlgB